MTAFTVLGDALLDVLAIPSEPMRPGADVPGSVRIAPGGQGANLAVRLARRGAAVELVCALADDAAGRLLRETLAADGVRLRALPADATGAVVVLVDATGERTMLSRRVPFAARLDSVAAATPDWMVVSGYLLLEPSAEVGLGPVAAGARRRAVIGCAVPDATLGAWQAAAEGLLPDVVVLNADEAERLPSLASPHLLVVTDPGGASAFLDGRQTRADRPPGSPPVDTTGAGDAFAAALLAELSDAWPPDVRRLEDALAAALAVAAEVGRVTGAQGRLPGEPPATLDR